jgi:hypothetical protein
MDRLFVLKVVISAVKKAELVSEMSYIIIRCRWLL